jgi:hypothetical protein
MGNPVFRFTLSHENMGTLEISEPLGWKQAKLKLERHPDFYSLVEYFDGDFIFYGDNGVDKGGWNFIKQVERVYGVDATIGILIDISFDDGEEFENIFTGQLDLSGIQELKNNKAQIPIIRSNFWAKFISRMGTPVDLQSNTDLDGNVATIIDPVDLDLTGQTIKKVYYGELEQGYYVGTAPFNDYIQLSPDKDILTELEEVYTLPISFNNDLPAWIFEPTEEGLYTFDILISASSASIPSNVMNVSSPYYTFYFKLNDNSPNAFTETDVVQTTFDSYTKFSFNLSVDLRIGDVIRIYGIHDVNAQPEFSLWGINGSFYSLGGGGAIPNTTGLAIPTYFRITGQTVYRQSSAQGFLLHDAAAIITNRTISRGLTFYSELLGSTQTNARTYPSDGCGWKFILATGLQLRGYTLGDKKFFMSFDKWWKGANPILNLGLGYEFINGAETIRVEQKEHWFDSTSVSVNIDNVYEIIREYDNQKLFKKIEVGYNKWQSEDVSGIDDPQTKHTYATRFQKVGETLTLHSDFIAASLAIEVTRRQTIEKSKDYKFDNDVFIVAINGDDISPDRYAPELDENFDSVTNLLNAETRYNLTLTPLRNLLRWMNFIVGGLQKYLTSSIRFVSGEGNYDMTSDYHCQGNACASVLGVVCDEISESDDIVLNAAYGGLPNGVFDYLFIPQTYKIEIDLSWNDYLKIKSNPKKAIGLSQTETGHKKFFIKLLEYEVVNAKATMTLWPAEDFDIAVPEFSVPSQECNIPEAFVGCEDAITDELGDDLVDENGDCITTS